MARWNLRNVPEELDKLVREDGARRGEKVRDTVLRHLCDIFGIGLTQSDAKVGTKLPHKFVPPSVTEANAEIVARGYHFSGQEFVAWNETRGWKTKQGPMKDWKAAMSTWEHNWKVRQEERANGKKLNYAEQRFEDNVEAANRLKEKLAYRAGSQVGGGMERANAGTAADGVRRGSDGARQGVLIGDVLPRPPRV